jgi:beta-glucosidase
LYKEDIALMKEIGLTSYRFSVEWSKIEPKRGELDREVLKHYHEMIDALIEANIEPMVTFHHFTHPIWFNEMGSWEKTDNIEFFVKFCDIVFREYQSKVKWWCTINEPTVYTGVGYIEGRFPPGVRNIQLASEVLKNLLEAHVRVYRVIKSLPGGSNARVGIVHNLTQFDPYNWWNPINRVVAKYFDNFMNESVLGFFKSGVFQISIPFAVNNRFVNEQAKGANDFFGLNYYSHYYAVSPIVSNKPIDLCPAKKGEMVTEFEYAIYAEGIYRALHRVKELGKPIIITENGAPDTKDVLRETWIKRYLYAVSRAIKEGVDVRGFYYWSLMDNFEWVESYNQCFGLAKVDFANDPDLKRVLRAGSQSYVKIIDDHKKMWSNQ